MNKIYFKVIAMLILITGTVKAQEKTQFKKENCDFETGVTIEHYYDILNYQQKVSKDIIAKLQDPKTNNEELKKLKIRLDDVMKIALYATKKIHEHNECISNMISSANKTIADNKSTQK